MSGTWEPWKMFEDCCWLCCWLGVLQNCPASAEEKETIAYKLHASHPFPEVYKALDLPTGNIVAIKQVTASGGFCSIC